ncbi:MAG: hypothetical protein OEV41_05760, partial [Gammaproteobacteria bacterium]|nr:hypothetical protein [Gammaproteobacteria bacterium]
RGASDPRETRGAQQLKANYGARRLIPKQQRFQRFLRDLLRINAEIMGEHFSAKTLSAISGTEVTDEMMAVMRSDLARSFTIDIETDSTVAPDDAMEKQGVAEFMAAMSSFVQQTAPIVASEPAAAKPVGAMLLWLSRKFKIARDVEQEIEDFVTAIQQQQGAQNSRADAEAQAEAAKVRADMQKAQAEMQMKQQKMQMELKLDEVSSQREEARKDRELAAEIRRKDLEAQARIERENALAGVKAGRETQKMQFERQRARMMEAEDEPEGAKIFRLIYDEEGRIAGGEVTKGDEVKRVDFVRDESGKPVGGQISA